MWRRLLVLALSIALFPLAAFAADPAPAMAAVQAAAPVPQSAAPAAPSTSSAASGAADYRLGGGDKVRIIVYGEDKLGGEFTVDGAGFIRLPLVGEVKAAGSSLAEFERQVIATLQQGYLKDPRVSVEVLNFRPFYILGEVNKPGEYPYVSDMSALNAVAMAGGFTYRANQNRIYIRRAGEEKERPVPADQTTKIVPGDIIRVGERFF